jgi:DNA-binding transcriptional LysR family regulator
MDTKDLATFATVARLGGMSRAARELNTVQSNVTQRVRRLEEALGVSLFERNRHGARLTAAGERLIPYAARVDALLAEAARAARDDGAPRGTLTIGALETTAALRLSPKLASYASRYPDVDLVLRTGTTAELIERVLDRELEGALVCGPVVHPDLLSVSVFEEELALLSAPAERSVASVLRKPDLRLIVLRAGCSYRQRLEEVLARRGVVGLRRLEFGTLEAILGGARHHAAAARADRAGLARRADCRSSALTCRSAGADRLRAPARYPVLQRDDSIPRSRDQGKGAMIRDAKVIKAPANCNYGLRDFDVADLDGNMIFFGMEVPKT